MGCDYIFTCLDCREHYDLGYGSCSGWICATNMQDFVTEQHKIKQTRGFDPIELRRNQALRECIEQHKTHQVHLWSPDWACIEDGKLVVATGPYYEVLANDVSGFDWIICWDEEEA